MANSHQRGKLFVSRSIQGRILGRVAAYWLIYHVVLWNAIFVLQYVQYRVELISGTATYRTVGELYSDFAQNFAAVAVCAGLLAPLLFYDIVRHTHRIAGPLLRYQNTLRRMAAGESVQPFKLRDGDMLTDFQNAFNEFLLHYNLQQAAARHQAAVASTQAGQPAPAAAPATEPAAARMSEHQALILETIGIAEGAPAQAAAAAAAS